MKKRRIVIASVLKPVNDTRMYEKLATTLADAGHEVWVLGYPAAHPVSHPGIRSWSLPPFSRLSLQRVLARWKILQKTIEVKPELLMVTTHELLIVGILNRIFFGSRLVYDVQENYYRNILWTRAFPRFLRLPLALWVRLKEKLAAPFIHGFLLAEEGYQTELYFTRKRHLVVANKCVVPAGFQRTPATGRTILLFTGTLAESTGVFQAIELTRQLHAADPSVELRLIGYCAVEKEWQQIVRAISGAPFMSVTGGRTLVPHAQIMEAIGTAHAGIVYYPPSPHIQNRIPTKLYEYLACRLPVLLQPVPAWLALAEPVHGAIPIDFNKTDAHAVVNQLKQNSFFPHPSNQFTWQSEAPKLTSFIEKLLK
ncbi:MAG: hypothetical protein ACOYXA_12845 [Bacteroidota bacterium]